MSPVLVFLFLFQSGLAFAFTWFIARVLLDSGHGAGRERLCAGLRKVRWAVAALTVVMPPALFAAYYKSLPEGKPVTLALWPALWILMILLAVVLALTVALRGKEGATPAA